jgi:hypothetical protein
MRLGYFTMPMHPAHRVWQETLREDRETVILADKLGFHDAFIGVDLRRFCSGAVLMLGGPLFEGHR